MMGRLRLLFVVDLVLHHLRVEVVAVVVGVVECALFERMDLDGLDVEDGVNEVVIEEVRLLCQWGIGSVVKDCRKMEVVVEAEEVEVDGDGLLINASRI